MTDARTALARAAERFTFSPTARLDAELLLAHALGIERNALLLDLTALSPTASGRWSSAEPPKSRSPISPARAASGRST